MYLGDLENLIDPSKVFHLMKRDSYSLMKEFRLILSKLYNVKDHNIEFTIGVTNSFFTLTQVMKNLGHKRVICESQGMSLLANASGCDLEVVFFERTKSDYSIDLTKLDEVTNEGDWLWLSNPHNPSGKYLSVKEVREIAQLLKRKGAYLFVDEIYHDFVAPLGVDSAVNQESNVIVASSLTKVYGLGGKKVGWITGPEHIIEQVTILRLHQFMLMPSPSLSVLIPFMDVIEKIRKGNILKLRTNLELFRDNISINNIKKNINFPEYGPIGLYKLDEGTDDIEFSINCSRRHGLVVAPGHSFENLAFFALVGRESMKAFKVQ